MAGSIVHHHRLQITVMYIHGLYKKRILTMGMNAETKITSVPGIRQILLFPKSHHPRHSGYGKP